MAKRRQKKRPAGGVPGVKVPGLRAVRYRLGLTQDQAAARVGIHPTTLAMWERGGGMRQHRLAMVARRLGTTKAELTTPPADELPTPPWLKAKPVPPPEPPPVPILLPGLRAVRYRLQLGPADFAFRCGLNLSSIMRIERGGACWPRTAEAIARRLGIDLTQLTDNPGFIPPPPPRRGKRQRREGPFPGTGEADEREQ